MRVVQPRGSELLAASHNCIAIVCGNNDNLTLSSQPMPNNGPKLCSPMVWAPIKITLAIGETKHSEEGEIRLKRQSDMSAPRVTQGLCASWAERGNQGGSAQDGRCAGVLRQGRAWAVAAAAECCGQLCRDVCGVSRNPTAWA